MRIIGYTYESDVHCRYCAQAHFDQRELDDPLTRDRDGNPLRPIFDTDENADTEHCGDCGEKLL